MAPVWIHSPHLEGRALQDRLTAATGTRVASAGDSPGDYDDGARVAVDPWRPLTDVRMGRVRLGVYGAAHSTVAVIRIADYRVDRLRDIRDAVRDPARHVSGQKAFHAEITNWMEHLPVEAGWRLRGTLLASGYSSQPRPVPYCTVDSATDKRIGLHLDSWDRLAMRNRRHASNRICVNLGGARRYLLFVPQTAEEMVDALVTSGVDVECDDEMSRDRFGRRNLPRKFLEVFPDTDVVRLEIRAGEAYVAPTENLIHDGSAPDMGDIDLCLTLRAHFHPA